MNNIGELVVIGIVEVMISDEAVIEGGIDYDFCLDRLRGNRPCGSQLIRYEGQLLKSIKFTGIPKIN